MNELRVDVRSDDDQVHCTIAGDVDLANAAAVEARLTGAIHNRATRVTLDLTGVSFIDSAGLQVVFGLAVTLRRLQIDLVVLAPEGTAARHAIEMAGMTAITSPRGTD